MNNMEDVAEKAMKIRLAIFDVDGVMTDGSIILSEDGNEHKIFHVQDGLGLVMLREAGFYVAVISARSSKIVTERMAALGIEYVYQGENDKGEALSSLTNKLNITKEEVAYTGDDLVDLPAMTHVGLPIAVANAHPKVIEYAKWTTEKSGGQGAVREICEFLLEAQNKLASSYQKYLNTGLNRE